MSDEDHSEATESRARGLPRSQPCRSQRFHSSLNSTDGSAHNALVVRVQPTCVDELVVSTVVYLPAEETYDFLVDFPGYANYSEHLKDIVQRRGDGGAGTRYALRFAWWKVSYTAHSRVTGVEPPERIDWEITKDIDAGGRWRVTQPETGDGATDGGSADDAPCEVALEVEFDPSSASPDALDLPRLVSFDWVVKKAVPLIRGEAERVVERAVRDLEGSSRDVDLDVYLDSNRI